MTGSSGPILLGSIDSHRHGRTPGRQRAERCPDGPRAHLRARDRRQRHRPRPRLRVGEMSGWLATILIFLPLAGALFIWLLPVGRLAGSFALLVALAEIGFWINGSRSRLRRPRTPHFDQSWTWFSDLGVSYHVGYFAFSFWLVGLAVVVMAAAIAYGFWVGRERPRAYFGLMLFLTSAVDRRLLLAGRAALLRLLRGDDDPALRPDRRLGRAGPAGSDGQVRHLHDGGLAADARGRDRLRPRAGHVRPDRERLRATAPGSSSASRSRSP